MERYIKAKDIKKHADCYPPQIRDVIANILRHTKSVDVVERKVGKWICHGVKEGHLIEKYTCSECDYYSGTRTSRFCPNCGARMKGEDDETD